MGKFDGELKVKIHIENRKNRYLTETLSFYSDHWILVRVPFGFSTDFASIPWLFRPIFPINYFAYEATIHDYLYRVLRPGRKVSDQIFLEACKATNRNKILSKMAYMALRVGGGSSYKKHDKKRKVKQ